MRGVPCLKANQEIIEFVNSEINFIMRTNMAVPSKEVFCYIRDKARNGNEMALVQLLEWLKFCTPHNDMEKDIYRSIHCVSREIFG